MSSKNVPTAKFRLGKISVTRHAGDVLTSEDILKGIVRHQAGDWGEVKDPAANDLAIADRSRIFSVYCSVSGVTFWIITEADRSHTTVLLPEDY